MIWLLLLYLMNKDKAAGSSSTGTLNAGGGPRPTPVLKVGASGKLWQVREIPLGGGRERLFEVSTSLDVPVLTYNEQAGERHLAFVFFDDHGLSPVATKADVDAAVLDFKLKGKA